MALRFVGAPGVLLGPFIGSQGGGAGQAGPASGMGLDGGSPVALCMGRCRCTASTTVGGVA